MTALASRAAGLRLTAIIGVLLVPVIVLSYFLATGYQRDLEFSNKEIQGLRILDAIGPVLLQISSGQVPNANAIAAFKAAESIAQGLGSQAEFGTVTEVLDNPNTPDLLKLELIQDLVERISIDSNLILDPDPESFFTISMVVHSLPEFLVTKQNFLEVTKKAANDGRLVVAEGFELQRINGAIEASLGEVSKAIGNVIAASATPKEYEDDLVYLRSLNERIKLMSTDTLQSTLSLASFSKDHIQSIARSVNYTSVVAGSLWKHATATIASLLDARIAKMSNQIAISMGVGLLSVLFGLGMAINLFRSTLKKLDDVELQRIAAVAARLESEQMAGQINSVNSQVTALNTELADNFRKLRNAQDELVEKGRMEQLGQLTATIAHEIRNPLGSVRTSAFVLEKKTFGKGLGVEAHIERINKGVTRCDNIINQLLDFSRSKQLSCQPAQLDDWLARVIEEEAARLPLAVSIECSLGLGERDIPFDPGRLRRAIVNLLSNASEAMVGTGDNPARYHTQPPRIFVATAIVGEHAVIAITDNGPGISPENLEKIREPLFTTKSFGSGLGVPAIEKILEQHGGFLKIESKVGKGATFSAFLPLEGSSQSAEAA